MSEAAVREGSNALLAVASGLGMASLGNTLTDSSEVFLNWLGVGPGAAVNAAARVDGESVSSSNEIKASAVGPGLSPRSGSSTPLKRGARNLTELSIVTPMPSWKWGVRRLIIPKPLTLRTSVRN